MNIQDCITVLVVDDHPVVRDGLSAIIDHQPDMEIVGVAADAAEAIMQFDLLAPDVTLVDLGLPDTSGIELIATLHAKSEEARFIVLTANAGGSEIAPAMRAGAHAYLFKNAPSKVLLSAIRAVACGGRYMSAAVGAMAQATAERPALTGREHEVLKLIVLGHSNSQIADALGISEGTTKTYVKNVLAKLGVGSRSKAAALGQKLGLVKPNYL